MVIHLGAAVSVQIRHVLLRGKTYYFHLRIPKHLVSHYGKDLIRFSLGTSDPAVAARKAEQETRKYQAEFQLLSDGSKATPDDIEAAGRLLAQKYDMNFEFFLDFVVDPARERYAAGDEEKYDGADPKDYLNPTELTAWRTLVTSDAFKLSEALALYLRTHLKGKDELFAKKVTHNWQMLLNLVGDIEFEKLNRAHARRMLEQLQIKGYKTATVRRILNDLAAVTNVTIVERELTKANPFASLPIPDENKDKKEPRIATQSQLEEIAREMLTTPLSATSLITLLQMELGTRIGEISGLATEDLFLEAETPYVHFRDNAWRTLKTKNSTRKVPLVGIALRAAALALALPRQSSALFEQYGGPRGNDAASGAVNKRLQKWGLKSHDFRHTMKDRLRDAGCPKDIRDAIQGHASNDVADNYGQGHSLQNMQKWLLKVAIPDSVKKTKKQIQEKS